MFLIPSTSGTAWWEVMNAPWWSLTKTKPGGWGPLLSLGAMDLRPSQPKSGIEQVSCKLQTSWKSEHRDATPPVVCGRTGAVPVTWVLGCGAHVPVSGPGMLRQKLCTAGASPQIPFILWHSSFGALAFANQFCSPQSLSQLFNLSPKQQKGFPFLSFPCCYSPTYIPPSANPILLQQGPWEPGDIPTGVRFTPSLLPFFPALIAAFSLH